MSEVDPSSRLLTVVFIDVEGSTALLDEVGDRTGLAAVGHQLDLVRERIEPYGGDEVKSLGDGLLVTFVSPRNAVAFALASQRALGGARPRVRIGINAGEVVVHGSDPVGGAVNAAARIAGRADGGEVLVSAVVRQLVGSAPAVRFVDRGRLRLRGFTERWHVYQAVDGTAAHGAGTVGRDDVPARIESLVSATGKGTGGSMVLEGEAGIGKSHLVRHAAEIAQARGLRVIETSADEIEQRTGAIVHGLCDAGPEHPDRRRVEERLAASAGEGAADLGFGVIETSLDLIETLAGPSGALLVTEDLHWADDLSLRVLAALARRAGALPVALLATCRPTPRPPLLDRVVERVVEAHGSCVQLEPLDDIDVSALVSAHLGAASGAGLRSRLDAASGNPLFVIELLNALESEGHIRIEAGVAEITDESLPSELRSILIRKLSWLDSDVAELLRIASILGGSFTLRDLAAVTGRPVTDVAARLHEAAQAALVRGEGDRLSFQHDLVREAIYGDMSEAVRQDLHRPAGDALAAANAPAAQVAHQYALGARRGDVDVVDWLVKAARESAPVDPGAAAGLLERALDLAPPDWPGRAALQVQLVTPYARSGRLAEAEAVAQTVLADPRLSGDDEYGALVGLASVRGTAGQTDDSVELLRSAARHPDAPPDAAAEMLLLASQMEVTSARATQADRDRIRAEATVAIESCGAQLVVLAQQVIGMVGAVEGREADAFEQFERARRIHASGAADWTSYLLSDGYAAAALLSLDRLDDAMAVARGARLRMERQAAVADLPFVYLCTGLVHLFKGSYDDAAAQLEAGLSVVEDSGSMNFVLYLEAALALISMRRGQVERAESLLHTGFERLAAGTTRFGVDWLVTGQAELLDARGERSAAVDLLATLWDQMAEVRYFLGFRRNAVVMLRIAIGVGRADLAAEAADALEEAATRTPATSAAAAARRGRAILDGDGLIEATELYRKTGLRPDLAECCEDAAAVLAKQRRIAEAVELVEEAIAIQSDLGAAGELVRVERLLESISADRPRARRRTRPTFGWESLTATELEVVELVAQGMTNPQIGARLGISRRTAETHLSHVFAKLGLENRAQVAAEHTRRRG